MKINHTTFGAWSGGRFMHYGKQLDESQWINLVNKAYDEGIRTFMTSDVYGAGKADELLGIALKDKPRDTYALIALIGHDIYKGARAGSKGYPRFTDPNLRGPKDYFSYLKEATDKSLKRCNTDIFDLIMLHNPDSIGYSSNDVWESMSKLRELGLTNLIGIAPGPANGFIMDQIYCYEKFKKEIDWGMLILNPLEPWPSQYVLPIAEKSNIKIISRVVDYGGLFFDDVKPNNVFKNGDHRTYRPEGWIEEGCEKINKMRPIAKKYNLSVFELACIWNLNQTAVKSLAPTFIQEVGDNAKNIEDKIKEFANIKNIKLDQEDITKISQIGNNKGCMLLKGASSRHEKGTEPQADYWPMRDELKEIAAKWNINTAW